MTTFPGPSDFSGKSTIWKTYQDKDPTKDLLQIVGSERIQSMLLDRNVLKKRVWAKVAEEMSVLGYDLGPDGGKACHQKWRNLKRAYIMYITKPGHRDPPYIKELQKALETTRKLIAPDSPVSPIIPIAPESIKIVTTNDSTEYYEVEAVEIPVAATRPPSNINIHVADVLAIMMKNNEERQKREDELEAMCEERFKKLEIMLNQQSEQLERLNFTMLEISNQCAKRRKYRDFIDND